MPTSHPHGTVYPMSMVEVTSVPKHQFEDDMWDLGRMHNMHHLDYLSASGFQAYFYSVEDGEEFLGDLREFLDRHGLTLSTPA